MKWQPRSHPFVLIAALLAVLSSSVLPSHASPTPAFDKGSVKAAAWELITSLMEQQRTRARAMTLDYSEFIRLSKRRIDKSKYEALVTGDTNKFIAEFAEQGPGIRLTRVELVDVIAVPARSGRQRSASIAVVGLVFSVRGKEQRSPFPLFFVEVDGQWRWLVRK